MIKFIKALWQAVVTLYAMLFIGEWMDDHDIPPFGGDDDWQDR